MYPITIGVEKLMSKLTDVRVELAANPAVSIIEDRQKDFMSTPRFWNHWVDIIVAPARGLYTAEELQKFMDGLVSIMPTQSDGFRQYDTGMEFGKLYFDEPIGTIVTTGTKTITITDPDIVVPDGYTEGALTVDMTGTVDLKRRTLLWVYPDEHYAQRAIDRNIDVYDTRELVRASPQRRGLLRHRR
ncbi:MAG TPA: hypothetical protein PK096_00695 [Candidatus Saccharibacteria bacterium]|nr:hypothetical protein [Candidatus Saccharibacteria bacterium]